MADRFGVAKKTCQWPISSLRRNLKSEQQRKFSGHGEGGVCGRKVLIQLPQYSVFSVHVYGVHCKGPAGETGTEKMNEIAIQPAAITVR